MIAELIRQATWRFAGTSRRNALVLLCVFLTSGSTCTRDPKSRQCGVFDHPRAARWLSYAPGDLLVFAGPNAGRTAYRVTETSLNEPFVETRDRVDDAEDIVCLLTARYVLESEDRDHALRFVLIQAEEAPLSDDEETLALELDYLRFADADPRFLFQASLFPLLLATDGSNGVDESAVESIEILGRRFGPAIVYTATEDELERNYGAGEVRIESLVLAEGEGVVALQRSDVGQLLIDDVVRENDGLANVEK